MAEKKTQTQEQPQAQPAPVAPFVVLPQDLAQQILNYLMTQPWAQVNGLISGMIAASKGPGEQNGGTGKGS